MATRDRRVPLEVVRSRGGAGACLVASEAIRSRSPFLKINRPRYVDRPTYQTVQVGHARHALSLGILTFINHSCHPNVIVDASRMLCVATRDIAKGEELSYFYPSTEWVMARPFRSEERRVGKEGRSRWWLYVVREIRVARDRVS